MDLKVSKLSFRRTPEAGAALALLMLIQCFSPAELFAAPGLLTRPENLTCEAPDRLLIEQLVTDEWAYRNFNFVQGVQMIQPPDDPSRWLIVQQRGVVLSIPAADEEVEEGSVFLDLSDRVAFTSEAGVTSLSYHPNYPVDPRIFVTYTTESGDSAKPAENRLASYTSSDAGFSFDPSTEQIIISHNAKGAVHPWSMAGFGPDGFIYISTGSGADNAAQDWNSLDGSFLRLDVDSAVPYGIPPGNPYADGGGAPEVFAKGFRNPFRWSFDAAGNLFVGDVGSKYAEEINLVVAGGNYGWPEREGHICRVEPCDEGFISTGPIAGFARDEQAGPSAILGGRVYTGSLFPELLGKYIYSNFVTGVMTAVTLNDDGTTEQEVIGEGTSANHVAEDANGELYFLRRGQIRRMIRADTPEPSFFPEQVSDIGCFDVADPTAPGEAMIPYDLNVPFWSDGAEKSRWFAVPDGESIHINSDGDFEFPIGSVIFKNFRLAGKLIETRMLALHDDGEWAGYTYEWDDTETEGYLVENAGKDKIIAGQQYSYPGRGQCLQCHTGGAGHVLGPEVRQLNRSYHYPSSGLTGNQLETYEHIGLLDGPLLAPPADLPALPQIADESVSLHQRTRAYFHANCSQCHMPGESGGGNFDMRFTTPDAGLINTIPSAGDLGVPGALVVTPGDPSKSVVPLRMRDLSRDRMPPIGSHLVHAEGVALVEAWISSLGSAPTVSIDSPLAGSTSVAGQEIVIEASAADMDGAVVKVEFYADSLKLGEDTSEPYSHSWSGVTAGDYVLTAVAEDEGGVTAVSDPVDVSVCEDLDGNAVCDDSPGGGIELTPDVVETGLYGYRWTSAFDTTYLEQVVTEFESPGTGLWLSVSGYDVSNPTEVKVRLNGLELGHLSVGPRNALNAGDSFFIDASMQQSGRNEISFEQEIPGRKWGVTSILLSAGDNLPPSVGLDSPAGGAEFVEGDTIAIEASANDGDGSVVNVKFYSGGAYLGESLAPPYRYDWLDVPAGSAVLTAVAEDDSGATTTSAPVSISVCEDGDGDGSCGGSTGGGEILLMPGAIETGQYGYRWGSIDTTYLTEVVTEFESPGTGLWLSVSGYDVSNPTEVKVLVNGQFLAYLSVGPRNALNAGDSFFIDASMQQSGRNEISFEQEITGRKWGVTSILLSAGDNLPPSVGLDSPAGGAEFVEGGTIAIEASADDGDGSVVSVKFYSGGAYLGESLAPPYRYDWLDVPAGSAVLTAVAEDDSGATTTSAPVSISVCEDGDGDGSCGGSTGGGEMLLIPGVIETGQYGYRWGSIDTTYLTEVVTEFESPGTGLWLSVSGYDVSNPTEVKVRLNGLELGHLSVGPRNALNAGDSFFIDASMQQSGRNEISFEQEISGRKWGVTNILLSAGDNLPPSVGLDRPAGGAEFVEGDTIAIEASADDGDGSVVNVKFYADGAYLGESLAPPYRYDWLDVPAGSAVLTAVAEDDSGATTTSAPVSISVCEDGDGDGACDGSSGGSEVLLMEGVLDTGQYGFRWTSPTDYTYWSEVVARFESPTNGLWLSVTGFDVSTATEVRVLVNGHQLGYLSVGPANALNAGDSFFIDASMQHPGSNEIRFEQENPNKKWGVTNLLLMP